MDRRGVDRKGREWTGLEGNVIYSSEVLISERRGVERRGEEGNGLEWTGLEGKLRIKRF